MSKSLRRVMAALDAAGIATDIREMAGETRTAEQAAAATGCTPDQIAKSIIFRGASSGQVILFLTAGSNRVAPDKAAGLTGESLGRADAALVRERTGFAIGGVSPIGHVTAIRSFLDPRLLAFSTVWAAAGTPRHLFAIAPGDLLRITGAQMADFTS